MKAKIFRACSAAALGRARTAAESIGFAIPADLVLGY